LETNSQLFKKIEGKLAVRSTVIFSELDLQDWTDVLEQAVVSRLALGLRVQEDHVVILIVRPGSVFLDYAIVVANQKEVDRVQDFLLTEAETTFETVPGLAGMGIETGRPKVEDLRSTSVPPAATPPSSGPNIPLIVGITAGGATILIVLVGLMILLSRRRRSNRVHPPITPVRTVMIR
jgi:hypothetical protein